MLKVPQTEGYDGDQGAGQRSGRGGNGETGSTITL